MMHKKNFLIALVVFLPFCQSSKIVDEKTGRAANAKSDTSTGYYYDDMARYLAGFDLPAGSNLAQYTQAPEYVEHRQKMVTFWEKVRAQSIEPISEWRESTLNRNPNGVVCREDRAAVYPLCGADIINLYTICPKASEYIMIALEKAGDLPRPEKQSREFFRGLKAMRHAVFNIADRNYFFSAHMKEDFVKNEEVPGIAPVLLAFASGLDWRIIDMEKIYLSPDGIPIPLDDAHLDFKPRGVRIWFRTANDTRLRSLTYIEQFLNAASVAPQHPMAKFLGQKRGSLMMMKAAVYLMHKSSATNVRDFFMSIPDTVVQDDSGFKYMDIKDKFDVSIYGNFDRYPGVKDIAIADQAQPDLTALYKQKNPPPLKFNFGYGSLRAPGKSNIMVAHRKRV